MHGAYTGTKNGGLNYFAKEGARGAHTVSRAVAPSSYRILKLDERDTTVSVFVGCTIPFSHRFRKKTATCLCENGPVVLARIPCDSAYSDSAFAADILPSAWRTERLKMFFKSYGHTCICLETQADHENDVIATEAPESELDNKRV